MVFLFIPNLIGYARFGFLIISLFTFRTNPIITVLCYGFSQLSDMFDGMAARKFNQATKFGGVLDMTCDRASDAVILAILGALYPQYSWFFYLDIILDLTSHWYQMYASSLTGKHHKQVATNWVLLQIYYKNKAVLLTLVTGNQVFFLTAYLNAFASQLEFTPIIALLNNIGLIIGFVLFLIKKLMSVIQLISASQKIAQYDIEERRVKQQKTQKAQ